MIGTSDNPQLCFTLHPSPFTLYLSTFNLAMEAILTDSSTAAFDGKKEHYRSVAESNEETETSQLPVTRLQHQLDCHSSLLHFFTVSLTPLSPDPPHPCRNSPSLHRLGLQRLLFTVINIPILLGEQPQTNLSRTSARSP